MSELSVSSDDVSAVPYSEIEDHKENILPLREGRSVQRLKNALSSDFIELNRVRNEFETRLTKELSGTPDPLGLWMEYIDWTRDAFPQGTNSKLLDVIERCLVYIKNQEQFRDDIRCLDLWLFYIDSFFMDSKRESRNIYIYMFRNHIATHLSKFYIEFSKLLYSMGKFKESYDFLLIGKTNDAQPSEKLDGCIAECSDILRVKGISLESDNNNDGIQINEYLARCGNPRILDRDLETILNSNHLVSNEIKNLRKEKKSTKLEMHVDGQDSDDNEDNGNGKIYEDTWDIFESKTIKVKENKLPSTLLEPNINIKPIPQNTDSITQPSNIMNKSAIFNDNTSRSGPIYKIIHTTGLKPEKIDCNFDLIYDNDNEYSIEQLLALARNHYPNTEKRILHSSDNEDNYKRQHI